MEVEEAFQHVCEERKAPLMQYIQKKRNLAEGKPPDSPQGVTDWLLLLLKQEEGQEEDQIRTYTIVTEAEAALLVERKDSNEQMEGLWLARAYLLRLARRVQLPLRQQQLPVSTDKSVVGAIYQRACVLYRLCIGFPQPEDFVWDDMFVDDDSEMFDWLLLVARARPALAWPLFTHLLDNVLCSDHHVLLDFIMSAETCALEYLVFVLKQPRIQGQTTATALALLVRLRTTVDKMRGQFPYNPTALVRRLDEQLMIT